MVGPAGERPRVLVALEPRLLATSLSRSLPDDRLDVVDLPDHSVAELGPDDGAFTCALVSGDLPTGVEAEVMIVVSPERPDNVRVERSDGELILELRGVEDIIALVERFCGLTEG